MGWFKKREIVPEVSPSSTIISSPDGGGGEGLSELPSFPKGVNGNRFTQDMVKSAISNDSPDEETGPIPSREHYEEDEQSDFLPNSPMFVPEREVPKNLNLKKKHTGPVFVRFDKFQESKKDFEEIRDKISEIGATLDKIGEVKQKEDEELKSWAEEVENIKAKLSEVDGEIFGQV